MIMDNARLAVIALLPIIPLTLMTASFGTKIGKLFFDVDNAVGDVSNRLQENVVGVQVVRAFAREPHEIQRFETANKQVFQTWVYVIDEWSKIMPTTHWLTTVSVILILWFGGQMVLPLVIRAVGGGGRQLGATHSQTPDAIFAHFPGLKVVSPGTPEDAKGLLKSAIRSNDPVLFIEHATMYQVRGEVPDGEFTIPIGKSKIQREGSDVTIITYCKGLELSMKAAEELATAGIQAEIVDLRTLRPLDMEPVLESFKKTNRAIVVEEGWKSYGVGSEVVSRIYEEAFDYVDAPILRVAQKEVPLPYNRALEQSALPQVPDIVAAVKEVFK